jgi:hypothetical protein
MERLPLVRIEQGHIIADGKLQPAIQGLRQLHDEHGELYVLDYDGIKYNRPNLDIFKKAFRKPSLWIDAFPRRAEDVIDLVVVGAKRVTVRSLMGEETLRAVRALYEEELYVNDNDENEAIRLSNTLSLDGIILFEPINRERNLCTWGIYPQEKIVKKIA